MYRKIMFNPSSIMATFNWSQIRFTGNSNSSNCHNKQNSNSDIKSQKTYEDDRWFEGELAEKQKTP